MFIQVLVKVDPGTVSNEKQKQKKSTWYWFLPRNGITKSKPRFEPSGARREKQPPSTGSTQERLLKANPRTGWFPGRKKPKCLSKYWLRWTQERCQTKNKNKKKNQPSTGFYPGTVLQKANPGLSLRVLAGKSNLKVLVLPRKGN